MRPLGYPETQEALASPEVEDGLTAGDIFQSLIDRKWFIAICALLGIAISATYAHFTTPVFEASASIRIDPSRPSALGLGDLGGGSTSQDLTSTEILILRSDGVSLRVLNNLSNDDFQKVTGHSRGSSTMPETATAMTKEQQAILDGFEAGVSAKQIGDTQLISVNARNKDPQLAANIANQIVSAYIFQTYAGRDKSVMQLRKWLESQMATLKHQVEDSQRRLAAFQQKHNVIPTQGQGNNITDRLRVITESLAAAQATRITKEAQVRSAKTGDAATLLSLFPSTKLEGLQSQSQTLNARAQQLSVKFGPSYPPLMEVQKQQQATNVELTAEINAIRQRLQQELYTASTTEGLLQNEYDSQAALAYELNRSQADYSVLQGEVTSSRTLYDTLSRKLQEAGIDAQIHGLDTMLVDDARVPTMAIAPKKRLILASGLIIGLFAGIIGAFLRDATSNRLRNAREIRKITGPGIIVSVPTVEGRSPLLMLDAPGSRGAEAYRVLRNLTVLTEATSPPRVFFVTSPSTEADPSHAANLSIALSQSGFRTLLIDTPLHGVDLSTQLGVAGQQAAGTGFGANIAKPLTDVPDLSVTSIGDWTSVVAHPSEFEGFRRALDGWRASYEYVLLTGPSPLEESNSLLLANLADAVVIVTRYHATELNKLTDLQALLRKAHAAVLGSIITDAP